MRRLERPLDLLRRPEHCRRERLGLVDRRRQTNQVELSRRSSASRLGRFPRGDRARDKAVERIAECNCRQRRSTHAERK
jgi:hypothetical protein